MPTTKKLSMLLRFLQYLEDLYFRYRDNRRKD